MSKQYEHRVEMLKHAYARSGSADARVRLVCGVPRELYDAALAEIVLLTERVDELKKHCPRLDPRSGCEVR